MLISHAYYRRTAAYFYLIYYSKALCRLFYFLAWSFLRLYLYVHMFGHHLITRHRILTPRPVNKMAYIPLSNAKVKICRRSFAVSVKSTQYFECIVLIWLFIFTKHIHDNSAFSVYDPSICSQWSESYRWIKCFIRKTFDFSKTATNSHIVWVPGMVFMAGHSFNAGFMLKPIIYVVGSRKGFMELKY